MTDGYIVIFIHVDIYFNNSTHRSKKLKFSYLYYKGNVSLLELKSTKYPGPIREQEDINGMWEEGLVRTTSISTLDFILIFKLVFIA